MAEKFVSVLDQIRDTWDRRARENAMHYACPERATWEAEAFFASGRAWVADHVRSAAAEFAPGDGPVRTLEIGCGPGRMLGPLAQLFDEVHGLDISPGMLDVARQHLNGSEHIHLHTGDGMTLQCVRRRVFDFVLSFDTFAHFPDPAFTRYVTRQIRSRLSTRGLVMLHLPEGTDIGAFLDGIDLQVAETRPLDGAVLLSARYSEAAK